MLPRGLTTNASSLETEKGRRIEAADEVTDHPIGNQTLQHCLPQTDLPTQVGIGAVALGCVSAAALGQVAVGIPCVIGGSASQGLRSFWEKHQQ
jgi:hypothetical protein